ncbi:MAG: tetratricopeptide repeat protein [Nitrospirae bacterium]|nr:tetratricopeptide repeat protein [Nitrospirota bacterium]
MNDKRLILISILLACLSCLVYIPALNNDFVSYDDNIYITENYRVKDGFTADGLKWAFTESYDSNWIPLTWCTHMLDVELYGMNPAGHHLTNILIHALSTAFLFLFLCRATNSPFASALAAALFGIHPLNVESTAWVAERKNVLSTFFWITAACAYVGYVRRYNSGQRWMALFITSLLLFALSLMSKPMAVTFPFALLLIDYWPLSRLTDKTALQRVIVEKIPFFFFTAAFIFITLNVQHASIAGFELLSFSYRISNALTSYISYIGKMLVPTHLAAFYPYLPIKSPWPAIGSGALLIVITTAVFLMRKTRPYLIVGWFWYLGTMVPVIQIVQVGLAPMADRYAYVPLIGIFMMISWGAWDILELARWRKTIFIILSALIIAVFSLFTLRQIGYWRDSGTLFKHALEVTKNNYAAYNSYGVHLLKQNRFNEALEEFYKGLEIMPADPLLNFNAWSTLTYLGKAEEAKKYYANSLPYWKEGRQPHLYKLLAISYMKEKNYGEAIVYFKKSLELNPKELDAMNYVGLALMAVGKNDEALTYFNRGLSLEPGTWEMVFNRGLALIALGRPSEAAAAFKETLALNPRYAPAKNKLDILEKNN